MKFPSIINYEKAISLGEKSFANSDKYQFTLHQKLVKLQYTLSEPDSLLWYLKQRCQKKL